MRITTAIIISLLILGLALPAPASEEELQLSIDPVFQFAPGRVKYTTRVARDYQNVYLCVGWDSESDVTYRRTCEQWNGIYAPSVWILEYSNLAPGYYSAFAELYRVPNRLALVKTRPFQVIESLPRR